MDRKLVIVEGRIIDVSNLSEEDMQWLLAHRGAVVEKFLFPRC